MESNIKNNGRNIGIDVLRGLCILAVILLHINIHFGLSETFLATALPKKLYNLLFWSGYYGVVIFFTLSGYLITGSILKKWDSLSAMDLKTFYWFRFSRIMPLLALLLSVLSILHLTGADGYVVDPEKTPLWRAIFSVLTFHFNWLEIRVGYLPANWDVLWSISIEESFYLVFPVVCLFLKKEWQFVFLLALFMAVSPWARTQLYAGNDLADRNHLAYLDSLAIGCMAAILSARIKFPRWAYPTFLVAGWALVILVVFFRGIVFKSGLAELGLNVTLLSVGVGAIVLWMHQNQASGRERKRRIYDGLKNMGTYSYEIYLTHMFVVLVAAKVYKHFSPEPRWLVPFILVTVILCHLSGKAVFHFFSEPVNTWLRKKWIPKKNGAK